MKLDDNSLLQNIDDMIKQRISEIHTAIPGEIIKMDYIHCRATVKPSLSYHLANGDKMAYPLITDVPVFMPRAGNSRIYYPVTVGDKCLIIFVERSLDEWIGKGEEENHDPRQFDMTDAFCFVGMYPAQSISPTDIYIRNNESIITIEPDGKIYITGDVTIIGDVHVQGKITSTQDMVAGDISVQKHTHGCPHGGSTSAAQ